MRPPGEYTLVGFSTGGRPDRAPPSRPAWPPADGSPAEHGR